jgi:hypothetical protein
METTWKSCTILALIIALTAIGCANSQQFLDSRQDKALQTAQARARFEMNCPDATVSVISRDLLQPLAMGPWGGGVQRAEFTVGAEGCGHRGTYMVICPSNQEDCWASSRGDVYGTGGGGEGPGGRLLER